MAGTAAALGLTSTSGAAAGTLTTDTLTAPMDVLSATGRDGVLVTEALAFPPSL